MQLDTHIGTGWRGRRAAAPGGHRTGAGGRRALERRPVVAAAGPGASGGAAATLEGLPDGRQPFWSVFKQLTRPAGYLQDILQGRDYAVGQMGIFPMKDHVLIGSASIARELLGSEERSGVNVGWPAPLVKLIGPRSVSMTDDESEHARLRALLLPFFSPEAVAAKAPAIQETARRYVAQWVEASRDGPFSAYLGMKQFTFDVLVNQVLELGLDPAGVAEMSALFSVWSRGMLPPDVELPFTPMGQGMAARREIKERVLGLLAAGRLPPGGLVARLQEYFGEDGEAVMDNIINLLFAGHDTSSSSLTSMVANLAGRDDVMSRLAQEQASLGAGAGAGSSGSGAAPQPPALSPAAAPYAAAVIRETLRLRPIVSGVMRSAVRDVPISGGGGGSKGEGEGEGGGAAIPAGCPFVVALSAMARREPAWAGDWDEFRPERFLAPGGAALAPAPASFNPFGIGQRYCLGSHLATAEMLAMVAELARAYETHDIIVTPTPDWSEFPVLKPVNGLPTRLVPRGGA